MKPIFTALVATALLTVSLCADPPPFPSDADIKKLPKEAIIATAKHQAQIIAEVKDENTELRQTLLMAARSQSIALAAAGGALSRIAELSERIDELGKHDQQMTEALNKASKSLWWYRLHWWGAWVVFALGVLACIALAFLKVTGRLAILGSQVAAKIP